MDYRDLEQRIKKSTSEFVSKMTEQDLFDLKRDFDNRYYNTGQETISDAAYDMFVDELRKRYPHNTLGIGCKLRDGDNAVQLPFVLNSMDKLKHGETKRITSWVNVQKCNEFVISDKLNGVSCLVCFDSTGNVKMYTRGDGYKGADISYFADKIHGVKPKTRIINLNVRGELIITTEKFNELYASEYKNSLAMLVSVVNSKTLKKPVKHMRFVAYEIVTDKIDSKQSKNFTSLRDYGFEVAHNVVVPESEVSDSVLATYLQTRYDVSPYSIDGIIIQSDKPYDRKVVEASGNPSYAIAYKMVVEEAETTVVEVQWNPTRYGYLNPRVRFEPVILAGAEIQWANGNNAKFIVDNQINVGSRIVVIRSGEIIPKIQRVITKSREPCLPTIPYSWNETHVDIVIQSECDSPEILTQKISYFFAKLGVKQVAEGIVKKLISAGHDTIFKILDLDISDLRQIPTFEEKMSCRIYKNIRDVTGSQIPLEKIMVASGCFGEGLGEKKITVLVTAFPRILEDTPSIEDICRINGFSTKTANKVLENLESFREFYMQFCLHSTGQITEGQSVFSDEEIRQTEKISKGKMTGQIVVFTNFRDHDLENTIRKAGGEIGESVTKKTTHLLIPDGFTGNSVKVTKARQYGVKIQEISEFKSDLTE